MNDGWKVKALKELCSDYKSAIVDGPFGSNLKRKDFTNEGVPVLKIQNVKSHNIILKNIDYVTSSKAKELERHSFRKNDIVMTKLGNPLGVSAIVEDIDQGIIVADLVRIRADKIDTDFLCYQLNAPDIKAFINTQQKGATRPRIKISTVRNLPIITPPLSEQKRIVAILDEAFEGIDSAIANTEKNLAGARELFESYLNAVFTQKGEGWVEKKLQEIANFQGGGTPSKKNVKFWNGDIPWVSPKDMKFDEISTSIDKITSEGIENSSASLIPVSSILVVVRSGILSRTVPIGITTKELAVNQDIKAIIPKKNIDAHFLRYCLVSQEKKILELVTRGATVHRLSTNDLKILNIPTPTIENQKSTVKEIDAFFDKTQRLETIYQQKLDNLTELKQSLLQKAFAGKLTYNNIVSFTRPVLQHQAMSTTSLEFGAHVIAYGYHWHEGQGKNRTYGHVKTQKFLHLAESIANVDMGRCPKKCAAGPHDAGHMRQAEDWAKENQFFEFVQRRDGKGYDFKKLANYNQLICNSINAVKPYQDKLQKLLALLLPMNTRKAEILATVHAAWNNLKLDNVEITDNAIIHEARENWTESKKSIPENEFREAIITIRSNGIVPDGTAKRVTAQESLPL